MLDKTKLKTGQKVRQLKPQVTIRMPRPLLDLLDQEVTTQDRARSEILIDAFNLYMRLKDRVALTIREDSNNAESNKSSTFSKKK